MPIPVSGDGPVDGVRAVIRPLPDPTVARPAPGEVWRRYDGVEVKVVWTTPTLIGARARDVRTGYVATLGQPAAIASENFLRDYRPARR